MELSPELRKLLSQGQGPTLHWFPRDVSAAALATVMVGMANTSGGVILIGVAPRSTNIQGIGAPTKSGESPAASEIVFQAALMADPPLVLPVPKLMPAGDYQVLQVIVPPGLPHVYNLEGRYLWREGAQTNPIPARRLRQLLLERGAVQFETQVAPDATLDDLDCDKIAEYERTLGMPAHETTQDFLLRRRCLVKCDAGSERSTQDTRLPPAETLRPTYAGLALFGRYPQRWLPSAAILAARFHGLSFDDQYIKQEIAGTLPDQLRQAEIFVSENLQRVVHLVGMAHQEILAYPMEAVRELLVNAVAHRDYNLQGDLIHLNVFSDRLEVHSPGRLPGPVTLENLLEARFSRNPVIVQVLADMGFIERLGYGLDRVMRVMRQSGLPAPRFEEVAGTFRVTLYAATESKHLIQQAGVDAYRDLNLNARQEIAINCLARNRRITNRDYQELCQDVHPETLRRDLAELVTLGVLIKVGDKKSTYYILKK